MSRVGLSRVGYGTYTLLSAISIQVSVNRFGMTLKVASLALFELGVKVSAKC